jgi:hypothetical protein
LTIKERSLSKKEAAIQKDVAISKPAFKDTNDKFRISITRNNFNDVSVPQMMLETE